MITKDTEDNVMKDVPCKACGKCCRFGSGFILQNELKRIADHLNLTIQEFKEKHLTKINIFNTDVYKFKKPDNDKPYAPCIFLKEDKCSIHKVRPLHCAIANCKADGESVHSWLLVNHILNIYDPESVRQYQSFLKTGGKEIKGAQLKELVPDEDMLKKILNFERLK